MQVSDFIAILSPLAVIIGAVLTYLVTKSKARTEQMIAEQTYVQEKERLRMELERLRMEKEDVDYTRQQKENERLWEKVNMLQLKVDELYRENGILKSILLHMGANPTDWEQPEHRE